MTTEQLLEKLEKVKRNGSGWQARCPSHEDRNPSLSIKEREDGMTLLHCQSNHGCTFQSICEALEIDPKDLMGEQETAPATSTEPETVYSYLDENGVELFQAVRFPGKKFGQRHMEDGKWVWNMKGVRRVLYHLPEVLAQAKAGGTIYVAEGEADVDALRADGKVATCNPMGAGKWQPGYSECLKGGTVIVIRDKDDPGRAHAETIKESLAGLGIKTHLVQARKGKDYRDHQAAGYKPEDLDIVRDSRHPAVITSSQMADNALVAMEKKEGEVVFYPNPWGFEEPEFVPGRLYVIGAWTGGGKSAFLAQLFRFLSERGVKVGLISNEMPESDFRNRILTHKGFKIKELQKPWMMSKEEKERLRLEIEVMRSWKSDIISDTSANHEKAGEYLRDGVYEVLCFDHLHNVSSVRGGEESAINKEIGGFASLALNFDVPVIVAGQFRRQPAGLGAPKPILQDFKGSSGIEQNAAMAMAFWRSPQGAELLVQKNRHGRSDYAEYLNFIGDRCVFEKREVQSVATAISWS